MRFALDRRAARTSRHARRAAVVKPTSWPPLRRGRTATPSRGLKLWQRLAETGVQRPVIPEEHGGLGADAVDLVVAFEQLGRHAVPGPLVESVAVPAALLAAVAPDVVAALAEGRWPPSPHRRDAVRARRGRRPTRLVAVGRRRLHSASAGEPAPSVDPRAGCSRSTAGAGRSSVADWTSRGLRHRGARHAPPSCSASGEHLLDVDRRLREAAQAVRRPIGQFQAVKHHLADVADRPRLGRPLLHGAALSAAIAADAARDVSAAKVACGDAAYRAARTALQVHGAIGYTAGARPVAVAHQGPGTAHRLGHPVVPPRPRVARRRWWHR